MYKFKGGYFLPHQNILIYINNNVCSKSDFDGINNKHDISKSEAAKRVLFEYCEIHSWSASDNIYGININNITEESIIMQEVKIALGEDEMNKAALWASEVREEYLKSKSEYLASILEKKQEKSL